MTKQEQIEEIAQVLSNSNDVHAYGLQESEIDLLAIDLYEKGYRKAEEVRKAMAKEILQKIYDEIDYYSCQPAIEQLAKEYGVEVEQ